MVKLDNNFKSSNKQSVCTLCWGFIKPYQRKKHGAHRFIVTPSQFKNEEAYMALCSDYKMLKEDGESVPILNETCCNL